MNIKSKLSDFGGTILGLGIFVGFITVIILFFLGMAKVAPILIL